MREREGGRRPETKFEAETEIETERLAVVPFRQFCLRNLKDFATQIR